jgi:hypothetical protein
VVILVLTGCGRIGFDPFGSAPIDAARDSGPVDVVDADNTVRACLTSPQYATRSGLTSRYREGTTLVTWDMAQEECVAEGAHLWIPNSALEAMTLTGDWVGITDVGTEGMWKTVSGVSASYLPWEPGQPDGGTAENCVRNADIVFEDRACTDLRDYVCECD